MSMMLTKWTVSVFPAIVVVLILLLASFSCTYGQANNTTTAIPTNTTDSPPITSTADTNMSYTFFARTNASASPALPPEPQAYCNASIVDGHQQVFHQQYMKFNEMTELSEEENCELRKRVDVFLVDYCSPSASDVYCDSYFDSIMCWPPSPVGLNNRPCPAELNGVSYDTADNVTRYCNLDGTWANGNKSNYSLCSPRNLPEMTGHDAVLKIMVYIGYSLSMTALLGAFCIFLFFRSLRCVRNYIHWNLVSSFILLYICFFTTTAATNTFSEKPWLHWLCRLSFTMMMYFMMTNFFWMFVEGVYLYTLVVRALTVRRNRFWIYCLFGWGGPVPFVVAFIIMKLLNSKDCWVDDANDVYLIVAPIICVILVNLYFLVHIMGILFTKLRASHSLETQQYRKGVKGTLFLLPLLGVTYLLFLLGPINVQVPQRPPSFYVYQYLNTLLSSLQGFFVAIIYVFLNQEVQNVIKRKIRRWREENTLPTRIVSRRGSNQRNSIGNIFVGRRSVNCGTMVDEDTNVSAFKLPAGNHSPDVFSNGSKLPPFIRLDEMQPLTPVSETHTSPQTLYSSLGSANGADSGDLQQVNLEEREVDASCTGTNGSTDTDCNELPLLAVNACGAQSTNSSPDQASSEEFDQQGSRQESPITPEKDQDFAYRTVDNNGLPNGNHNNNNSLSPCLARPKTSPFAGRTRVTFAEDPIQENHKRPACCDTGKNNEGLTRSPTRKVDEPIARGQVEGDDSLEAGFGKQDPQRSPLIPCIRKKGRSTKPNGTIAFPKAPEGTPV